MRRGFVIFGLACLAACGTLDEPALDHVVDAPKGPFSDSGGFEVCIGSAHLVPVEAGGNLVGLCVKGTRTATTCTTDDQCATQEACFCGECKIRGCVSTTPCAGGLVCADNRCAVMCGVDADCASGEVCNDGACSVPCKSEDDCGFGEGCDALDQVCLASLCATDSDCGNGHVCSLEQIAGTVREPAWATIDGEPVVYLEVLAGKKRAIYRAPPPTNGRLSVPADPVVGGKDVGAPAPFATSSGLALFAESGDSIVVLHAMDDAGTMFGAPEPVLSATQGWEMGHVGSPSVVSFQGATWMFYQSGAPEALGVTALDGALHAQGARANPILTAAQVATPIWIETAHLRAPDAVVADGMLLVYFTANGIENGAAIQATTLLPATPNDSIGLAATADVVTFDVAPWGPVLARRTNLRTFLGERESSVRLTGNTAEMLYVSSDADGTHAGLSLATSP